MGISPARGQDLSGKSERRRNTACVRPSVEVVAGLVKVSFHQCLLFEYESTNRAKGQKRRQLMSSMNVAVQADY